MALISIDAFAEKCNMPRRALMVYVKRKNVIVDGETVDTNNDKNLAFYNKREAKGLLKPADQREKPAAKVAAKRARQKDTEDPESDDTGEPYAPIQAGVILSLTDSEKRKKHFDAVTAEKNVTLREIEIQKKMGEVVPTDSVVTLFKDVLRVFAFAYRDLYEREVQKIAALAGLSTKEIADLRTAGINGINDTYSKALRRCRDSVKSMVTENADLSIQDDDE